MTEASQAYHQQIDAQAVRYLLGRGIGKEAATGLRLGKCSEPLPGHERFRDMLCIPYCTPAGVVALKFRCMGEHDCKAEKHIKYDQPDGQQQRLYNAGALHRSEPYVGVAEGELTAGVLDQLVGIPTVGAPGTGGWLDHYPRVFADYERVFVFEDNDTKADGSNPGRKFARKVAKSIGQHAVVISPPDGMDADEWLQAEGPDVIRKACGIEAQ